MRVTKHAFAFFFDSCSKVDSYGWADVAARVFKVVCNRTNRTNLALQPLGSTVSKRATVVSPFSKSFVGKVRYRCLQILVAELEAKLTAVSAEIEHERADNEKMHAREDEAEAKYAERQTTFFSL